VLLEWHRLLELTTPTGGSYRSTTLAEASRFCLWLARRHYENFPVASLLLPRQLRPHVAHLYAFARTADDIADFPGIASQAKLAALHSLEELLLRAAAGDAGVGNPLQRVLAYTLTTTSLPVTLLQRLLCAFRSDAEFRPFATWAELEAYCDNSANPIGEALLRLTGVWSEPLAAPSNALCTGLQVLNFLQDLSVDLPAGRLYIPLEMLARHGLPAEFALWGNSAKLRACLAELSSRVAELLHTGSELLSKVSQRRLRLYIAATLAMAQQMVAKVERLGPRLLVKRPKLHYSDAALLWRFWSYWRR
jgi:squalene synthase HpnC